MNYHEFCETCRDLYRKKVYIAAVLNAFVRKGALKEQERDAIVNGELFEWERPEEPTEVIQNGG